MGRYKKFKASVSIPFRIEKEMYQTLKDIATAETIRRGSQVHVQELIRDAINFVYVDNERLRECFRRSRYAGNKKYLKKVARNS
jgi:hypothetical protein